MGGARRRVPDLVGGRGLGVVTAACAALSAGGAALAGRRRRGGRGNDDLVVVGASVLGTAVIAAVELLAPGDHPWRAGRAGRRVDAAYIFGTAPPTIAAAAVVARVAGSGLAPVVRRRVGRSPWPSRWPLPARIGVALLVSELVHYWHHRAFHRVGVLWRMHAVHHSATEMSWTNSLRFHPVDHFTLVVAQSATLAALGMDPDASVGYSIFRGIHGQVQHANIAGGSGRLGAVLSTAEQHRWHHAGDGPTVNYGAVLSIWDRVFATFDPGTTAPASIGDADAPTRLRDQLAAPFLSRAL